MARGNNNKNAAKNANQMQPRTKPGQVTPFQQECKKVLQRLCEDNSTTIINVAERYEKLKDDMAKIQEAHKKRTSWKTENELVPSHTLDQRLTKCNELILHLKNKYNLDNLNHVKVVKEFDGLGLRKTHENKENLHKKEMNEIRIPVDAMLTCDSVCNSKEFEKFITNDRMTKQMMNVRLALRLVYHKYDPKSDHHAWMNTLPSTYSTPLFWAVKDYKGLQLGFEACNEDALTAFKFYTTIARQYLYFLTVFSTVPSLKKFYGAFTWDAYRWAVSSVQTRGNQLSKNLLGFIPVLEMCNTNLKSEMVIGRIYSDEEFMKAYLTDTDDEAKKKIQLDNPGKLASASRIAMAELDITPLGNNKNIYFSYSGNINNRSSLQSLLHNSLLFTEKVEITVHLPQSRPLHQDKVDYMKFVGGDDFNTKACLSPLVRIKQCDSVEDKMYALNQMINFLVVALDREPNKEEDAISQAERKLVAEFEKKIKAAKDAREKHEKAVADAKKEGKEAPETPADMPEMPNEEDRPPRTFIYDYKNAALRPRAREFLKIRLTVLKRYLDKVTKDDFENQLLAEFVLTKHKLFVVLIEMVEKLKDDESPK